MYLSLASMAPQRHRSRQGEGDCAQVTLHEALFIRDLFLQNGSYHPINTGKAQRLEKSHDLARMSWSWTLTGSKAKVTHSSILASFLFLTHPVSLWKWHCLEGRGLREFSPISQCPRGMWGLEPKGSMIWRWPDQDWTRLRVEGPLLLRWHRAPASYHPICFGLLRVKTSWKAFFDCGLQSFTPHSLLCPLQSGSGPITSWSINFIRLIKDLMAISPSCCPSSQGTLLWCTPFLWLYSCLLSSLCSDPFFWAGSFSLPELCFLLCSFTHRAPDPGSSFFLLSSHSRFLFLFLTTIHSKKVILCSITLTTPIYHWNKALQNHILILTRCKACWYFHSVLFYFISLEKILDLDPLNQLCNPPIGFHPSFGKYGSNITNMLHLRPFALAMPTT